VIVPSRNEVAALPALLASLSRQTRAPHEVIVVDDESDDGTGAVAEAYGVTVIRAGERPEGWLGKPWACHRGAAAATGEVLLFLDADTDAAPGFLRALAPLATTSRGLVSVAPFHQTAAGYEQASALFNLVAAMGTGMTSIRRNAAVAGAFGPCIAMRAADYAAVGGHAVVRGDVLEDVGLAERVQWGGRPVVNVAGGRLLRYRMYGAGPMQLVEGWSKNFAAGAGRTPFLRFLGIAAWLSGLIESGWWTVGSVAGAAVGAAPASWTHVCFYALFAGQLLFLFRRIGSFAPAAWLHPLASAAFLCVCARSVTLALRGEVTWKGRRITRAGRRDH
jgi:hypothetical protein